MNQIPNSKSQNPKYLFSCIKSPIVILLGIIILGFLIRIIPYHTAIQGQYINFFEQDPYYHLRRVFLALSHHLHIPDYDSYSGFPQGLHCFWPALFDLMIAIPAWLIGLGHPSKYTVELVAAFVPPILGALTTIPVYLLTKELFRNPQSAIRNNESSSQFRLSIYSSNKIALLTALFYSIFPGHIYWTLIGRPDHHCAEPIFPLLMFWFVLVSLRKSDSAIRLRGNDVIPAKAGIQSAIGSSLTTSYYLLSTVFSSIMLVCSLLIWGGATIFIGILVGYLLVLLVIDHGYEEKTRFFIRFISTLFGTALLILLPICASTYWGKHFLFAYDALSWFQLGLIGGILIVLVYLGYLSLWLSNKSRWWFGLAGFWSLAIIFGLIFIFIPSFISHFINGIGWIIKSDPWLKTITEFQPLFISMGVFSSFRPTSFFGYGLYLLPLVYWIMFYRMIKDQKSEVRSQKSEKALALFAILFISIVTLGLMQSRFSHFLSYIIAIGYAFLTLIFVERFKEIIPHSAIRIPHSKISFLLPTVYGLLSTICLLFLLLPCIREIRSLPGKYARLPNEWHETLLWLRDNTPPTRFYNDPAKTPEYGILAPWASGHWINYIANRPTISNGFHTNAENNRASMEFYLTEDEMKANRILDEKKARYLILTDLTPNLIDYGKLADIDASIFIFHMVQHPKEGGTRIAFIPTQEFYRLISSRLYLFDGIDSSNGAVLSDYRLVYENPSFWNVDQYKVSCLKVFEHVKGATITGHAIPKSKVRISVPIITNTNREFNYTAETTADYTGTYKFIVPYSTDDSPYATKATSSYAITWPKLKKPLKIEVAERQIIKGETINLINPKL